MLGALKDQVTYARSHYDAVLKQFQFGTANSVDVMDANTLLVTAERQLSDADSPLPVGIENEPLPGGVFISLEEREYYMNDPGKFEYEIRNAMPIPA